MTMPRSADLLRILRACTPFLLGATVFAAAYGQAPLYYSNQNQYFLHGLADAGYGLLGEDWLANTRDPTPVFTALVTLTMRHLHLWAFYGYYLLLFGVYTAALFGLFRAVVGDAVADRRWPVFFALFVTAHAALPRWASYQWLGQDYPWFFQAGVAGQYVLGAMFQPSTFGVLLVAAICLFVRGRPYLAGAAVALAATLHFTYLLPGALLTLGFLTGLWAEGRLRQALLLGMWTLALVLPAVAHGLLTFAPTSAATFAAAQDILVNVRIPHHTRVDRWLDPVAALQIACVVLALVLVWRSRLFLVLAVPLVLAVLLTLAQVVTGSHTLALLFPWRLSAVLVPVATTVVLARLAAVPVPALEGTLARGVSAAVVLGLAAAGVWVCAARQGFHSNDEELPLLNFVRETKTTGDVYFVPVAVPKLAVTTRGSLSSDFKPLPDKKRDARVIPVDLQRFRLTAGAPIFVDFKAIPYLDVEVLEWHDRLRRAESLLAQIREGRVAEAAAELRRLGVTHLILPASVEVRPPDLKQIYEDLYYRIYRLSAAPAL